MIERAGNHRYQWRMILNFTLVFLLASFIQMGFPIFFQWALFKCPPDGCRDMDFVCAHP